MDNITLPNCYQDAVDVDITTQNVAAYFDVTSHTEHDMTLTLLPEETMEPSSLIRPPADLERTLDCTSMTPRDMTLTLLQEESMEPCSMVADPAVFEGTSKCASMPLRYKPPMLLEDSSLKETNMVQNCRDHEDISNSASGTPQEAPETTITKNCSINSSNETLSTSTESINSHQDDRRVRRAPVCEGDKNRSSDNNPSSLGNCDAISDDALVDSQSSSQDTSQVDDRPSSDSDVLYRHHVDVNNSGAVGRFLEPRPISEGSSSGAESQKEVVDSLEHREGKSRDEQDPEDRGSDNNLSFLGNCDAITDNAPADSHSSSQDTSQVDDQPSSDSDIFYRHHVDINNSAAVGRFLEPRPISEGSSSGAESQKDVVDSLEHREGKSRDEQDPEDRGSDNNLSSLGNCDAITDNAPADSHSSSQDTSQVDDQPSSDSDIFYRHHVDINNSAAVGRFLEPRAISEGSSSDEEAADSQKEVLDSLEHSEGRSRDDQDPENAIRTARSVDVEVFRAERFLESTPCSDLGCTPRKRALAASNVLSPIKCQVPITRSRDISQRRRLEQASRQQVYYKENINITKNCSALQSLNGRHRPIGNNGTFSDHQLSSLDCSAAQSDPRFFRAGRLKKIYVQQYLRNTEYRRTCERSKKYFTKKTSS
ncbi:uncharacterized protein LOC135398155 [Ornithodoros turicata]|uniref:uncharacterized protein LOC135398155 n=1 Tax=Ornithodoros turicata TaxID=34597 RepID=UPI003139A9DE